MSYQMIYRSTQDFELVERIMACVTQEAWNNPSFSTSDYAKSVKYESENSRKMIWAVCIASDIAGAYEYAVNNNNPNPGGDPAVITDGMILANVQAKWPFDYVAPAQLVVDYVAPTK